MRVLIVEDDGATSGVMARSLRHHGYTIDVVTSGAQALAVDHHVYDAAVLDLGLPDGPDGLDVCAALRERGFWGAILIVTARAGVLDRVGGLDAGADDYIVKPFTLAEFEARLRAQTRRPSEPRPPVLECGELRLESGSMRCWRGPVEISLSRREFAVLREFMRHPDQVLTRLVLLERAWEEPDAMDSNVVDQTVHQLRRKIDEPFGRHDLETVRGSGYRLHGTARGTSAVPVR